MSDDHSMAFICCISEIEKPENITIMMSERLPSVLDIELAELDPPMKIEFAKLVNNPVDYIANIMEAVTRDERELDIDDLRELFDTVDGGGVWWSEMHSAVFSNAIQSNNTPKETSSGCLIS